MRVPLLAGIRERNELTAARQRLLQAERNARELEVQVRTELDAAVRRVEATATTARSNRAGAEFRAALLRDRLKAREAGRMETRIVLEAEQEQWRDPAYVEQQARQRARGLRGRALP